MERGRAALRASRLSGRGRVCRYAVGVALWALSSVVSAFVPLTVRLLCAFSACFAHPRSSCPLAGAGGGAGGGECGLMCGARVSKCFSFGGLHWWKLVAPQCRVSGLVLVPTAVCL